ncbi:MAG: ral stress protein CsbD [Chitinophagaceae bacterium]|nr:ral stress protein CsbD [Chitinophagaceae bacterium]
MGIQLKLEAPWDEVKENMKENSIELTDADLVYEPGKEEELLNRLAKKMNRTPQQIKILIESISSNKGRAS